MPGQESSTFTRVLAAYTPLPVIGVPIKSSTMDGPDSLLSIVQMPSGVPVATVAINGWKMQHYLLYKFYPLLMKS